MRICRNETEGINICEMQVINPSLKVKMFFIMREIEQNKNF